MLRKKKNEEEPKSVDPKQNDNRKLWPRITPTTPPKKAGK